MSKYSEDLINKGYVVIKGCVNKKILNSLQKEVKDGFQEFANLKKRKQQGIGKNFRNCSSKT